MLTSETSAVDRLATSAVAHGEVAALEHELQRKTTSGASILRGTQITRAQLQMVCDNRFGGSLTSEWEVSLRLVETWKEQ